MLFSMTHLYFDSDPEVFDDTAPPAWLASKVFKWWFDDYVCKLPVGGSISSDFRLISRVK